MVEHCSSNSSSNVCNILTSDFGTAMGSALIRATDNDAFPIAMAWVVMVCR